VRVGRFLNLDRLAARFNQWIGATAMADKAAPGDATMARDPSAVVGVLGEIERHDSDPESSSEDEDLPPLNLGPVKHDEGTVRSDD
jgi:hypothetical protein